MPASTEDTEFIRTTPFHFPVRNRSTPKLVPDGCGGDTVLPLCPVSGAISGVTTLKSFLVSRWNDSFDLSVTKRKPGDADTTPAPSDLDAALASIPLPAARPYYHPILATHILIMPALYYLWLHFYEFGSIKAGLMFASLLANNIASVVYHRTFETFGATIDNRLATVNVFVFNALGFTLFPWQWCSAAIAFGLVMFLIGAHYYTYRHIHRNSQPASATAAVPPSLFAAAGCCGGTLSGSTSYSLFHSLFHCTGFICTSIIVRQYYLHAAGLI